MKNRMVIFLALALGYLGGVQVRDAVAADPVTTVQLGLPSSFGAPVRASSPTDGQSLVFNAAQGAWIASAPSSSAPGADDFDNITGLGADKLVTGVDADSLQASDATLSSAELLDLTDTGGLIASFVALGTGVTGSDVRLKLTSGALEVRTGDDLGGAPVIAATIIAGSADTSGWRLTPTSSTVVTLWEGDGTDPAAVENFQFGSTAGWPLLQTSAGAKATPAYSFVGDANNGWYRAAADEQGFATAGVERLLINDDGDFDLGFDGAAAPFGAELMIGTADQTALGLTRASTDTGAVLIQAYKTRGTLASPTDIATGDSLLSIHANARIASALEEWGRIECSTDGTIGTGDRPSKWSFYTVPDGSNTLAEVFRIDQAGDVRVYGGDVFLATLDASGWKVETSASRVSLLEGDGTALTAGDELALGSTTGDPMLRSNPGATNGGFCFVGDNNTTMYRSGADTLAFATGGTLGMELSSGQDLRVAGGDLTLSTGDTDGFRLARVSATTVRILQGDASDVPDGELFTFGNTAGRPSINATDYSRTAPNYSAQSDDQTGYGFVEAGAPGVAAEGQWRTIWGNAQTLPDNTITNVFTIPLSAGQMCGGNLTLWVHSTNGTTHQSFTGVWNFTAKDTGGTLVTDLDAGIQSVSDAFTGLAVDFLDGTNAITFRVNADSSVSTPTITCAFKLDMYHSAGAAVTIP